MVRGRPAGDVLPAVADALTPLEPELVETDVQGLVTAAIAQAPRRSLIVLLTSLDAAPVEEGLPVLPQLTQRHTALVAAVSDPHIADMAAARGTVEAMYEAAAGVDAQAQRRRTADQLKSHGAFSILLRWQVRGRRRHGRRRWSGWCCSEASSGAASI